MSNGQSPYSSHTAYLIMVMTVQAGCANARFIRTTSSPPGSMNLNPDAVAILLDQQAAGSYQEAHDIVLARARENPTLRPLKDLIPAEDPRDRMVQLSSEARRNAICRFLYAAVKADKLTGDDYRDSRLGILFTAADHLLSVFKNPLP